MERLTTRAIAAAVGALAALPTACGPPPSANAGFIRQDSGHDWGHCAVPVLKAVGAWAAERKLMLRGETENIDGANSRIALFAFLPNPGTYVEVFYRDQESGNELEVGLVFASRGDVDPKIVANSGVTLLWEAVDRASRCNAP